MFPGDAPVIQESRALPGTWAEGPGDSETGLALGAQGGTGEAEAALLLQSTWGLRDLGNYLTPEQNRDQARYRGVGVSTTGPKEGLGESER